MILQDFCASGHWYCGQCLEFLNVCRDVEAAHGDSTNTVREPALKVVWEKNPLLSWGVEPVLVLRLALWSDALCCIPPMPPVFTNGCAFAHRGCTNTVRESVQKVGSGRKIPCCPGELNLCQYSTWFFGPTHYRLS